MPRGDGTGPMGQGENNMNANGKGMQWGNGYRNKWMGNVGGHGFGRGMCRNGGVYSGNKSLLAKQKEYLLEELDAVNKQLENK